MIYVDTLLYYGWKLGPSCHMIADNVDELHKFAAKIGLKKSWFQNSKADGMPHYDLTTNKRRVAVIRGAIEVDRKKFCELMAKYHSSKVVQTELFK